MWTDHWGLKGDPFLDPGTPYVPLPAHEEAVARLVHTIEAGHKVAIVNAASGLGKTRVLHRALAEVRHPSRRFSVASGHLEGERLAARLAGGLGMQTPRNSSRDAAWRALQQAVRVCSFQRFQAVLVIDGGTALFGASESNDLLRLLHLEGAEEGRLTVVIAAEEAEDSPSQALGHWSLAIRLRPLSRSEAEFYISSKLEAAGSRDAIFTRRALNRLHVYSSGSPRGLDRLASLSLLAGASQGLEAVTSELVGSVLAECRLPIEHALRA
jgi:type II secretory pathway predicted ATPase ExeA